MARQKQMRGMHYSDYYKIPHQLFVDNNVFDGYIDADAKLHIDPMLLKNCSIMEFVGAYEEFINYFRPLLLIASRASNRRTDNIFYRQFREHLEFPELPNTGLGYSETGKRGTGISGHTTDVLTDSALEIIEAGIKEPEIFAIMHFIEEGIGSDRISDMVINVLSKRFLRYTERITKEFGIPCKSYRLDGEYYQIPVHKRHFMVFIPCQFLCDLPIAHEYDDIDRVSNYNRQLRRRLCEAIGISWKDALEMKKPELKRYLINNKDLLSDILSDYKCIIGVPYDFKSDEDGKYSDIEVREYVRQLEPLPIENKDRSSAHEVFELAKCICEDFAFQVENRGMWKLLYNDDSGTFKKEEAAQLVFFMVAEHRCRENSLFLCRENDSGIGEIDAEISYGSKAKTIIEIKKISNNRYMHGYEKQLIQYMKSEQTPYGIYVVLLDIPNCQKRVENLTRLKNSMGENAPELVFIDALPKDSASKT